MITVRTLILNSLRGRALQWAQAYVFAHPIPSTFWSFFSRNSNFFLPVKICLQKEYLKLQALVCSGAEQSFIDQDFMSQLSLPTELLDSFVEVAGLAGGSIHPHTGPILLITSGKRRVHIQLCVTQTRQTPIVLRFPCLHLHNLIGRKEGLLTGGLVSCLQSTLPSLKPPASWLPWGRRSLKYLSVLTISSQFTANQKHVLYLHTEPMFDPLMCFRLFNLWSWKRSHGEIYSGGAFYWSHLLLLLSCRCRVLNWSCINYGGGHGAAVSWSNSRSERSNGTTRPAVLSSSSYPIG